MAVPVLRSLFHFVLLRRWYDSRDSVQKALARICALCTPRSRRRDERYRSHSQAMSNSRRAESCQLRVEAAVTQHQ